jgi:glycosyltransferase involved in cell wall biosynthesis
MSGTPLVLPAGGCAREYFGDLALYVNPGSAAEIRRAVLAAVARPRSRELAEIVEASFSWLTAAEITREAYARLL